MEKKIQNLRFEEKQELMFSFPNIKLCYDNICHNKVERKSKHIDYDLCCAIPCGRKCFSWFTQYNDKNVCFILELINKKHVGDIKLYNCVFNNELVYGKHGTIFYGTLFHSKQNPFFAIEDVFYYKGNNLCEENWFNKLSILKDLFHKDIKQIAYNKNFIVFGFPLMAQNLNDLKKMINELQYKIYDIHLRSLHKKNVIDSFLLSEMDCITNTHIEPLVVVPEFAREIASASTTVLEKITNLSAVNVKIPQKNVIFKIKADIQNDIYHLYCLENNMEIFYNVAYIPDYKTSVMMNKLFRNIKENENLDLLEESDDEDEFQNENIDKFVDINKSYLMICKFNHKFKKWYPVKKVDGQSASLVEKIALFDYEKNNYVPQQRYQNYPRHHQEKKHYNNNNTNNKKFNNKK